MRDVGTSTTEAKAAPLEATVAPLAGVRMLDLSGRLGAYCTKLLADLGADVVLVELPTGHELRRQPPLRVRSDGGSESLAFAHYHQNKRGISLDWTSEEALPLLEALGASADAVVISPTAPLPIVGAVSERPALTWASPSSVVCSITPYGLTGPQRTWRATPFTSFAGGGEMHPVGPVDGPPVAMPGQQMCDVTGIRASILLQAVLLRQPESGPQGIDLAVHDVSTWQRLMIERFGQTARVTTRQVNFGPPPSGVWQCLDGTVDLAVHAPHHWDAFVDLLGRPDDLTEPIYRDRATRAQLFDMLTPIVRAHLATMSAQDVVARGQAGGLPCALMYTPDEYLADVQPSARGFWLDVDTDSLGQVRLPGRPFRFEPPLGAAQRPAPRLGEHNEQIYIGELGISAEQLEGWRQRGIV